MSIGVRVSVGILVALVLVCAGVSFWALIQRQTLQQQNQGLNNEISNEESKLADLTSQAKQLKDQADQLNDKLTQAQQDKVQIQSSYDQLKQKSDDLQSQLTQANSDRDDWKSRVDTITRERDNLLDKLKNPPVKIVYRERVVRVPAAASPEMSAPVGAPATTDQYWASVLRQKAALQVEVQHEKSDLNQAALQVADLKKQNSDLETQVQQITNEKDEIVEKIKYGQDLADNLSIDLARSRNDQQAVNDRADKLKQENLELLSQVRDLNSIKVDLEKTVSRLTDEKDAMQKKLIETESVIQNRIDDIWKIKQSLDKKLSENQAAPTSTDSGMELPPIIVNAPAGSGQQTAAPAAAPAVASAAPTAPTGGKSQGTIISINSPNNFVIADLGQENSSVNIGTNLKVYRDDNPIATLQVIQVRKDICAADIKDHSVDLQVGDVVRFE